MKNKEFAHLHVHNEFCLAGDTLIYNCRNHYINGEVYRNDYTNLKSCKTIKYLYDQFDKKQKGGSTKYNIKVFDGEKFVSSRIKKIAKSSPKQLYKITTESGKSIRSSKLHKFLSKDGWKRVYELSIGDLLACNGQMLYENKDWLYKKYFDEDLKQQQIADICCVSRSTIKKWIKVHNLHKTKSQWMKGHYVDKNTGKKISEAKLKNHEKLKSTTPKTISASRNRIHKGWYFKDNKCNRCGSKNKLLIHHIDRNPLNNSKENLETLCKSCHEQEHSPCPLTVKYEKIIAIEKDSIEEVYDLEVFHNAHNFVANGFVTHNSYLDGYGSSKAYAEKAKELGFQYLGLTNHGNVDGLIQFQKECDKVGIKPILGCELYIVPDANKKEKNEKRGHLTVLVENEQGWHTLCRMLTKANLQGFYSRPRVDYTILDEDLSGLVFMTACCGSFVSKIKTGIKFCSQLIDKVGAENVLFEIMPHEIPDQHKHHQILKDNFNSNFIASNDCHYILEHQWETQEVLLAINSNKSWNDPKRWKFGFKGLHLRTADEMIMAFKSQGDFSRQIILSAMEKTIEVAEKCSSFRIQKQDISLPSVPKWDNGLRCGVVDDKEVNNILLDMCNKKLLSIFNITNENDIPKNKDITYKNYKKRLQEEFKLISSKNFSKYFLIVKDFIEFCHSNDIAVGPGRGSVGGSLIAYLIGITQVDPILYNLSFSRFLSEDRIDYPDIDIDVEKRRRQKAIQYIYDTYGENNVCGISTLMKMQSRAALADIGRIFEIPRPEIAQIAESIWDDALRDGSAIKYVLEETDFGQDFQHEYPRESQFAIELEGQARGVGRHAAGIVISGKDLTTGEQCVLTKRGDHIAANWDMKDCEYTGLMKLDVLGLATLSVIKEATRLINNKPSAFEYAMTKDDIIDNGFQIENIPLDDKKTFYLISEGKTAGVFQLSGAPLTKLCVDMGISTLEDIIAANALVRPGPKKSGMTDKYIERKHGIRYEKTHRIYDKITANTYGILVYQEQIMKVISQMAGMSESDADKIRKIIAKKSNREQFEEYKKEFISGCKKQKTFTEDQAQEFWEGLQEWASYGFNKCLSGDTKLTKSSYNQYSPKHITIEDLYTQWHSDTDVGDKYRARGLDILQMSETDNRCRPGKIIGVYYQGKKNIFQIKTKTGKSIKATSNHRLFTYDGYKTVDQLKLGDRVACMGQRQQSISESKGQKWKTVNTKGKCGFQKRELNPAYIDGRSCLLKEAKKKVYKRSNGYCEHCKIHESKIRFEYAHIQLLDQLNNSYEDYHNEKNILYLCNACHKKFDYDLGVRKKRYSKGYPIFYDKIIYIEYVGVEDVFDVEMQAPFHNFIANDIVSHNSHSTAYSILAYQTAYLKTHYPAEFYAATLTYGEYNEKSRDIQKHKQYVIDEAVNDGFTIMTPKVKYSNEIKWTVVDNVLYAPFIELKGIGESNASKCLDKQIGKKPKNTGFFGVEPKAKKKTKIELILDDILAEEENEIPSESVIEEYLSFKIKEPKRKPARQQIIRNRRTSHIKQVSNETCIQLVYNPVRDEEIINCSKCTLRKQASEPVLTSVGKYNVFIIGEAPGPDEDNGIKFRDGSIQRMGFIGRAGNEVWKGLERHGIKRSDVFVSNICRCYPSETRTPNDRQILACKDYVISELKNNKCKLVLAFGNTCLTAFKNQKSGIINLSGSSEFISQIEAQVVWCVHPSALLRNRSQNEKPFLRGLSKFAELFEEYKK